MHGKENLNFTNTPIWILSWVSSLRVKLGIFFYESFVTGD